MVRRVTAAHEMLRETEHPTGEPDFTHDVVAISPEGEVVFETEALFAHEVETALDDYPEGENAPDGVDHYEVRER